MLHDTQCAAGLQRSKTIGERSRQKSSLFLEVRLPFQLPIPAWRRS
jgi:hypothetical protein